MTAPDDLTSDQPGTVDARAAANTDRELFREDTGEPAGSYYENSLHVTAEGTIGMNVGGTVYTLPIAKWHALATTAAATPPTAVERSAPCQHCLVTVVERDGKWVHVEGDEFCRQRRATPNPPHRCGSRDGLSGCWHPSHGGAL